MNYQFDLSFNEEISSDINLKVFNRFAKKLQGSYRAYFVGAGIFAVISTLAIIGQIDVYRPIVVTIGVVFFILGIATYRQYTSLRKTYNRNVNELRAILQFHPEYKYWINDECFGLKTYLYHIEYRWSQKSSVFIEDGLLYLKPFEGSVHTMIISEKEIGVERMKKIKAEVQILLDEMKSRK